MHSSARAYHDLLTFGYNGGSVWQVEGNAAQALHG
jgi:hypothetical protein